MFILMVMFFSVIIGSAICSMAEAALLSLSLVRARILVDEKKPYAKDLLKLKEDIAYTIASIVVVNNAVNIIGSIFVGHRVALKFGNQWLGFASTVMTFAIIVAGEILPKTLGERHRELVSLALARPLRIIVLIFGPIVKLILRLAHPFVKNPHMPRVTEKEIKMMLQLARKEGTVEMDEEVLCTRVFKLNDVRAAQIMRPIEEMFALPANRTLGDLKEEIINSPFSRIAVYDKDRFDIIGTVQHRILLREIAKDNYSSYVREFMRPPIFVNWFTKADTLLEKFQAYHQHLFVVQDSQGKDVGLVTMEDVLEELFGDIFDEKDAVRDKDTYVDVADDEKRKHKIDIQIAPPEDSIFD